MQIAIIAHLKYPIAQPFAGGLEMHTHALTRHLSARGHDVTLFAAEKSDCQLNVVPCGPPTGMPQTPAEDRRIARAERAAYRDILQQLEGRAFDVIHNNALHALPVLASDRTASPVVTVLHAPRFAEMEHAILNRGQRGMRFVAVSDAVAAMWRPIVAVDEVIPNGVELEQFAPSRQTASPPYAVWTGRIVPEKGLHFAIAAARRADIPLRIAGPLSDPAYWGDTIAPMIGEGATYLGHLPHDVLAAEVAGAAVAVVTPCFDEPFGLVVAEALACGTPVAGFARGALPELLNAATGRLAASGDIVGLARAIAAAASLSRPACRARAEAISDIGRMVDRYEALYRRLTSRSGGKAEMFAA